MDEDAASESIQTLDTIVLDGSSDVWLKKHQLAPSTWNLDAREVQRILAAKVGLFVFHSPLFALDLRPNAAGHAFAGHLIFCDARLVQMQPGIPSNPATERLLSREEAIAMILHEIGHRINRWHPPRDPAERMIETKRRGKFAVEFDADDYARHCGFGDHLANGLQKLGRSGLPHFDAEVNRQRIGRIKDSADIQRHFS